MEQTLKVRALGTADASAWRSLRLAGLRESAPAFCSSFEDEEPRPLQHTTDRLAASSGEKFTVGAFDDAGRLVGIAGFYRETLRKTCHRGTVWGMYVSPEARGRGAGRALLEALVERAAALPGLRQVTLTVTVGQDAARALYERLGFRAWGLEPGAIVVDGRPYDQVHMILELPAS